MIKAGAIDKGTFLLIKEDPYVVVEREFVNPGKGAAFVRLKLKNLRTGQVLRPSMKTQDNVEEIQVTDKSCQYLYNDGESLHFMDTDTFEQFEVPVASFEEKVPFMKDGQSYKVVVWENEPLDIKLPLKEIYVITEAEEAIKGDTVTGATKTVTVETGLTVKVHIFIKQGEKILVNTETREYVERVNT